MGVYCICRSIVDVQDDFWTVPGRGNTVNWSYGMAKKKPITHWQSLVIGRPLWTAGPTWTRRWPSWQVTGIRLPTTDRILNTQGLQWEWLVLLYKCWWIFYVRMYGCTGRWTWASRRRTTGPGRIGTGWGAARPTRGRSETRKTVSKWKRHKSKRNRTADTTNDRCTSHSYTYLVYL